MSNSLVSKLSAMAILAGAIAVPAAAVTFTTNTVTYSGLGDSLGTQFDKLTLGGISGTITHPGTYTIATYTFVVGVNSSTGGDFSGVFTQTGTFGSFAAAWSTPYTLNISTSDTLSFGGSPFTFGGFLGTINPVTLVSGGDTLTGVVTATITAVPEVNTWIMLVAGFGLVGIAARRRTAVAA